MLRLVVGAILSFASVLQASGQAVAAVAGTEQVQERAQAPDRISVAFENTPLQDAIWMISKRSGRNILFASNQLPKKDVTYKANNVTPELALGAVLSGTGMQVEPLANGALKLIKGGSVKNTKAQGVLVGKVTDARSGRGIIGATISIGNDTKGTVTGEDGAYRLAGIVPGTHTVTVRLVGYAKQSRSVAVGEGAIATADFKIEPSANVLDQVVVTGTATATELRAVPNAITIITAKQIEDRGITRIDQLFRGDIPGLFAPTLGSASLLDEVVMFSRGGTSIPNNANSNASTKPIKTYVDGVELADPTYLSKIDPKSIERIEILTGPQASTIYGSNAINGVMQVFTKRGITSSPKLTFTPMSGWVENNFRDTRTPQHDYSAQLSSAEKSISYNIGSSWNYIGPWTPSKQTTVISSFGGARFELPTRVGQVTSDVSFRRSGTKNQQRGEQTQKSAALRENGWYKTREAMGLSTPSTQTYTGQTLGVTITYTPSSWWSHELKAGHDVNDGEDRSTAWAYQYPWDTTHQLIQSHSEQRSVNYKTTARISLSSLSQILLTAGADSWQGLTSSMMVFPQTLTGTLAGYTSVSRQPGHNAGGFFQTQIGFKDQLFVTYGLRAEWNPNYGEAAQPNYAPRYGAAYTQEIGAVTTKLRASYGRSTRPPLPTAKLGVLFRQEILTRYGDGLLETFPNLELLPENQQGWEGGIEAYFGNRASIIINRYNQTVDDLISYVNVDSVDRLPAWRFGDCATGDWVPGCYVYQNQALNIGTIRNQGWELQGNINIGPIATRSTYTWTKSRVLGITPKYRALLTERKYIRGAMFENLAEHTWSLNVSYARASNTVAFNFNGVGPVRIGRYDDYYFQNLSDDIRFFSNRQRINADYYYGINEARTIMDMVVTQRFTPHLEGVLQVFNVGNWYQKNEFWGSYATIGRQTKLGARWRSL